ncbi:MAG: DUF5615 family PIN-like protein [Deltaproteobacteria bacterium]|nr:DUF5615 family PIN-like protein [Deltaproteobacteria bacterium]
MKFKLDECLDVRLSTLFYEAGHDVHTVYQEKLSGAPDEHIYSLCLHEKRALVTQDMDFSNPFRFSPLPSQGIIVLRNPSQLLSEAEYLVGDLGDVHKKVNNSARAIGNGERRVERIDNRGRRAEDKNAGMLGFRD